jgi:hypothetical protein
MNFDKLISALEILKEIQETYHSPLPIATETLEKIQQVARYMEQQRLNEDDRSELNMLETKIEQLYITCIEFQASLRQKDSRLEKEKLQKLAKNIFLN